MATGLSWGQVSLPPLSKAPMVTTKGYNSLCCNNCPSLQVKQIEKRDSVLTSKNQIDRLTRPGSSYFNLNPFEVSLSTLPLL